MENKKYDLSLDCFMNFFSNEIIHLLMYCFCNMNRECNENHSFFSKIHKVDFLCMPSFLYNLFLEHSRIKIGVIEIEYDKQLHYIM